LRSTSTWAFLSTLTWSSALTLSTFSFSTFSCCVPFLWHVARLRLASLWSSPRPGDLSSPAHASHLNSIAPQHLLGVLRKVRVAHVVPWVRTPPQPCQSQARYSGNCSSWAPCTDLLDVVGLFANPLLRLTHDLLAFPCSCLGQRSCDPLPPSHTRGQRVVRRHHG